jgi:hypothetical protein
MNQALPALPKQTASLYSSFIGAADKLALTVGSRVVWITVSGPNENSRLLFLFGSPVLPSRQSGRQAS